MPDAQQDFLSFHRVHGMTDRPADVVPAGGSRHGWHRLGHAGLLAASVVVAACVGTPLPPPADAPVPVVFTQAMAFRLAHPASADVPDDWWRLFSDPVLDELQQRLQGGNLSLQAAAAAVDGAQAALAGSRAAALPSVGLGVGASRSENPDARPTSAFSAQAALATWELDVWGRVKAQVAAADARAQASRATLAATRLSLQATLVQTYFAWRHSQVLQGLLERSVASYAQSLALVQNRQRAGVVTMADVAQARSQWQSAEAQLAEARLQGTQLRHAVALLVGEAPGAFELPPAPHGTAWPVLPGVPDQLPSSLLERRPDIAAAQRQMAAANAQVGAAEAAFFPAVTLSASAGFRGSALAGLFQAPNQWWSLGSAVAVSLFDGGARTAARASAEASYRQAVATYRQTVLSALQEVEDNLAAAAQLARIVEHQTQALASAQQALAVIQNQYQAGTVGYLNVLAAQNAVLTAERSLLDARNRQLAAFNQLLKNVAGRWE